MSNIKRVAVCGHVPFNLADHPSLARKLAFFNTPTSGLKIEYGAPYEMRQNAHGGQTAMYPFCVKGEEAVSASYVQSFIDDIYAIGGKVTGATVTDIEANETCKMDFKKIQFPMVPNFGERPDASGQMLAALKGILAQIIVMHHTKDNHESLH